MISRVGWRSRFLTFILILWVLQGLGLAWRFGPDLPELWARIASGRVGEVGRAAAPFQRLLRELEKTMPGGAAYVFLDHYEAGRYIEARYYLYPRRQLLLRPETPPSFLYYAVRQHQAGYLVAPEGEFPAGAGLEALARTAACRQLHLDGPGRIYRVNPDRLTGFFYD